MGRLQVTPGFRAEAHCRHIPRATQQHLRWRQKQRQRRRKEIILVLYTVLLVLSMLAGMVFVAYQLLAEPVDWGDPRGWMSGERLIELEKERYYECGRL